MALLPRDPQGRIGLDATWRIEFTDLAAALLMDLEATVNELGSRAKITP